MMNKIPEHVTGRGNMGYLIKKVFTNEKELRVPNLALTLAIWHSNILIFKVRIKVPIQLWF